MTGAELTARKVRAGEPGQLLSVVPALLGFQPSEGDLVVIGTGPPGDTVALTLRYALPGAAPAFLAAHAAGLLACNDCTKAVAVGYGPGWMVTPFLKLLRRQDSVPFTGLLRVRHRRYWSLLCAGPACFPPQGTPYDPDPALAAAVAVGPVLASRDVLAAAIAPQGTPAAAEQAHVRAAGQTTSWELPDRLRAVRRAITAARGGHPVRARQHAARLAIALGDLEVRDDAWCRMDPRHRAAHLELWTAVTRLAAPGAVPAPACLLAVTAMQAGNGALANLALDRALDADPGYRMARYLRWAIDIGSPPSEFDPPITPQDNADAWNLRRADPSCNAAAGTPPALPAASPSAARATA